MRRRTGRHTRRQARRAHARRACASRVLLLIGAMIVTVFVNAWPSFSHNGLSWFGPGGDVDTQLRAMQESTPLPGHQIAYFRAWPLIWGTLLTTVLAVAARAGLLDPRRDLPRPSSRHRRCGGRSSRSSGCSPACPSVVYGLIGILAIAPWINHHLISNARKQSVAYVVQLNGADLTTGDGDPGGDDHADHGRADRQRARVGAAPWREGSAALGVNRWRTIVRVSLRTARPAIVAATVLATARALGEAIMLAMVAGGRGFAANPLDGITFLFEPVRPLAATIVQEQEGLSIGAAGAHDLRDRRRPARLRGDAVVRRLGGQAAAQALRDPRLMRRRRADADATRRRRRPIVAPQARAHRRLAADRPRSATGCAGRPASALCLITAGDRRLHAVKGIGYLRPSLFVESPAASLHQSQCRRLPRPDRGDADHHRDRHADRRAGRRRARRLAVGVRAAGAARARRRIGGRDDRRRPEHRARDLRPARLLRRASSASSPSARPTAPSTGARSSPPASSCRCSRCR